MSKIFISHSSANNATDVSYALAGLEALRIGLRKAGLDAAVFRYGRNSRAAVKRYTLRHPRRKVERYPSGPGEHEGGGQCFTASDVSTRNCRYAEYFA